MTQHFIKNNLLIIILNFAILTRYIWLALNTVKQNDLQSLTQQFLSPPAILFDFPPSPPPNRTKTNILHPKTHPHTPTSGLFVSGKQQKTTNGTGTGTPLPPYLGFFMQFTRLSPHIGPQFPIPYPVDNPKNMQKITIMEQFPIFFSLKNIVQSEYSLTTALVSYPGIHTFPDSLLRPNLKGILSTSRLYSLSHHATSGYNTPTMNQPHPTIKPYHSGERPQGGN